MNTKNLIGWIIAGVVVAAIIIFVAVKGGFGQKYAIQPGLNGTTTAQGVVAVPGTNAVSNNGQVLTETGAPVQLNVSPNNPSAPKESKPVAPNTLPPEAVKITAVMGSYTPSSFTVKSGQPVVLSLTSGDQYTHGLMFSDPSLSAVVIGVGPGETRAMTFNAPAPGIYQFYSYIPGEQARGEVGTMTVQ